MAWRILISVCFCAVMLMTSHCDRNLIDCSQKGDQMKINGVSLAPEYDSAVINVTFVLDESTNLTSGSISWMVTHGYVFDSGTYDLCDTLPLKCPVKPGKGLMVFPNPVPGYVHTGYYKFIYNITDQDKRELTCFRTELYMP